jgi:glycosyltransferase involved in cell wall biosynthesis
MDRLWIYMLCYNEELLLPFTLDYYSRFAERIFVYDNMSTDSSLEICKRYQNVTVIPFDTGGLLNDRAYLKIKNNVWKAARKHARYVAVIDADEIIYHKDGLDVLLDRAYDAGAAIIKQPIAYAVYSANITDPAGDISLSGNNQSLLCGAYGAKISLFSPELRSINYLPGAHQLSPKGRNLSQYEGGIWFHYSHVFGAEMMAKKYQDRVLRLSPENRRKEWGVHYALSYEDIVKQMHLGQKKLSDIFIIDRSESF